MARGWESKSVEAQQAEANEKPAQRRPPMSAQEAARWREKENLRLARQTVLQQLQASQNPRHRKLLEDSLAELDEKLKEQASAVGPQTSA
jgi:predicted component of type VI protein secretion system